MIKAVEGGGGGGCGCIFSGRSERIKQQRAGTHFVDGQAKAKEDN